MTRDEGDETTLPEVAQVMTCPNCGSDQIEESTTVDLAFGEEIPCRVCKDCGHMLFSDESP